MPAPTLRKRSPRLVLPALVAGSLLLAAAPAGAATTPEAWAGKVCSGLDQWVTALQQRADAATSSSPQGAKATKKALVGVLKQAEAASKKMLTKLRKAGTPSGGAGKSVAKTALDAASQAADAIAAARKDVQKLKTGKTINPAEFAIRAHRVEDVLENVLERVEGIYGNATTFDRQPLLGAFTQASACQPLSEKLAAASTVDAVEIGTLSPGSGPSAGTVITIQFAGVDADGTDECYESSAFRSEFISPEGARLSLGSEQVRVPDGAPVGVSTVRIVCYFPGEFGRPLMRSLCGRFEVTSSGAPGPRATDAGVACPPTGRVVGGDAMIAAQRTLGGTFDALLQPLDP